MRSIELSLTGVKAPERSKGSRWNPTLAGRLTGGVVPSCRQQRPVYLETVHEIQACFRTFVLVLDQGEEAFAAVTSFANEKAISAASVAAIGALERAKVGWFDLAAKRYSAISVDEQCEVLSLLGDIAQGDDGKASLHVHAVCSDFATAVCGEGIFSPTPFDRRLRSRSSKRHRSFVARSGFRLAERVRHARGIRCGPADPAAHGHVFEQAQAPDWRQTIAPVGTGH